MDWCRQETRQQAIACVNVDQVIFRHMAGLVGKELECYIGDLGSAQHSPSPHPDPAIIYHLL